MRPRILLGAAVPSVPSLVPSYRGTVTTTTNEISTTWNNVDIGTPHPQRLVILAGYYGVAPGINSPSATINGYSCFFIANLSHEVFICWALVPRDTTATIVVSSGVSGARKAVAIYATYPKSPIFLDGATVSANTTTNANAADIRVQAGGFLIYAGCQHATLGTFTTTWNGSGTLVEDVDAQIESVASYTMGNVHTITTSSDLSDLDLAESASGTKRLVCASWGPPYHV